MTTWMYFVLIKNFSVLQNGVKHWVEWGMQVAGLLNCFTISAMQFVCSCFDHFPLLQSHRVFMQFQECKITLFSKYQFWQLNHVIIGSFLWYERRDVTILKAQNKCRNSTTGFFRDRPPERLETFLLLRKSSLSPLPLRFPSSSSLCSKHIGSIRIQC